MNKIMHVASLAFFWIGVSFCIACLVGLLVFSILKGYYNSGELNEWELQMFTEESVGLTLGLLSGISYNRVFKQKCSLCKKWVYKWKECKCLDKD